MRTLAMLCAVAAVVSPARVGIQWSTRVTTCWRDMQSRSLCASMLAMGYCQPSSSYFEFVSRSCCQTCKSVTPPSTTTTSTTTTTQ